MCLDTVKQWHDLHARATIQEHVSVDMSVDNIQQGSRHTCSELFKQDRVNTAQDGCQHLLLQESHVTVGCTLLGRHQSTVCILQHQHSMLS